MIDFQLNYTWLSDCFILPLFNGVYLKVLWHAPYGGIKYK